VCHRLGDCLYGGFVSRIVTLCRLLLTVRRRN
jgi:hypothetical protein